MRRQRADSHSFSSSQRGSTTNSSSSASFGVGWNVGLNLHELEKMLCSTLPSLLLRDSPTKEEEEMTERFQGLQSQCQSKSHKAKAALNEVAEWMSSLLSQSRSKRLPTLVIAELHSYIGLIREIHGDTVGGIHSYTTALWLLYKAKQAHELVTSSTQPCATTTATTATSTEFSSPPFSSSWMVSHSCTSTTSSASSSSTLSVAGNAAVAAAERSLRLQLSVTLYRLGNAYGRHGDMAKRQALMDKAVAMRDDAVLSDRLVSMGF